MTAVSQGRLAWRRAAIWDAQRGSRRLAACLRSWAAVAAVRAALRQLERAAAAAASRRLAAHALAAWRRRCAERARVPGSCWGLAAPGLAKGAGPAHCPAICRLTDTIARLEQARVIYPVDTLLYWSVCGSLLEALPCFCVPLGVIPSKHCKKVPSVCKGSVRYSTCGSAGGTPSGGRARSTASADRAAVRGL